MTNELGPAETEDRGGSNDVWPTASPWLPAMLDAIPLPAILVDAKGIILAVNPASLDLARRLGRGIRREERIGQHISQLAAGEAERDRITSFLDELFASGGARRAVWDQVEPSGRRFHWEMQGALLKDASGEVVGALILRRDVTERAREEQRRQGLSMIRDEVWRMESTKDMDAVLQVVGDSLRAMEIPFDYCGINIIEANGELPPIVFTTNHEGRWVRRRASGTETIMQLWREGEVAYRRDLDKSDPYGERGRFREIRSLLDVPFSHGTVAVSSRKPEAFSEGEVAILRDVARLLSEGFARMEGFEALERRNEELESEIVERRRAEKERRKVIAELEGALARISTLRGLLPICANCKKIRDDEGYWHQVEVYLREHSEAEFTHGICPECVQKLYPDFPGEG